MKRFVLLLAFVAFIGSESLAQQGIRFIDAPWEEVLEQARQENKLIFLDAYASWCGPCKMMDKNVFSRQEVGEYFNRRFINVRKDMEKGEGKDLSRRYGVRAYPTFLFLDPEGQVVHRTVGYHETDKFLELGAAALDPTRQLATLEKRFAAGERDPAFLLQYAQASYNAMDGKHGPIAEAYLQTQPDWGSDENMEFIYQFTDRTDSKLFDYLVQHRQAFEEKFGSRAVTGKIENLVQYELFEKQDGDPLEKAERLFAKVYPDKAELMSSRFRMVFYRTRGQFDDFARAAKEHYSRFPATDWEELNEAAWTFYEYVDGKKHLKQALKWAKQSVEMDENYYNTDTLAALYFKLGKKGKARKAAERAITLAEQAGEDASLTRELLKKINGE